MENSNIEWTDHTFNPWWGCEKISPACAHCYAAGMAKRTGWSAGSPSGKPPLWGPGSARRFFDDAHWAEPLRWNARAEKTRTRMRVFCASMADVFEDREELTPHRARLFDLIRRTPWLDWLLLTKRPENWRRHLDAMIATQFNLADLKDDSGRLTFWMLDRWISRGEAPENVQMGTTAENQEWADPRVAALLKIPARVRFLSCEPLLGAVDIRQAMPKPIPNRHQINWVIAGGESGPGARPMHPDWPRSLRDQCNAAGVAFFFKQWGEWIPLDVVDAGSPLREALKHPPAGKSGYIDWEGKLHPVNDAPLSSYFVLRAGKKAAGRRMDGREWNEFPGKEAAA